MLRILFRSHSPICSNRFGATTIQRLKKSPFSTVQKEINKVQLSGTIYKHLFELPSGYQMYMILTKEPANKFFYHMVGTGMKSKCSLGQRISLVGRMCSQNYWNEDGKLRQKVIIKTGDFELLPPIDAQVDTNSVQLFSQISSDIENTRDYSTFIMTTQHRKKGGTRAGIYATENHRILVREPSMLDFVRNKLKKSDWIHVDGRISYTFSRNPKEKLRSSGHILANGITKENEIR